MTDEETIPYSNRKLEISRRKWNELIDLLARVDIDTRRAGSSESTVTVAYVTSLWDW